MINSFEINIFFAHNYVTLNIFCVSGFYYEDQRDYVKIWSHYSDNGIKFLMLLICFSDDATAGPPPRMPEGVKPLCGYVHPDDAKKWMVSLLQNTIIFLRICHNG